MKKIIILLIIFVCCACNRNSTMVCTYTNNMINDYKTNIIYSIKLNGDKVSLINIKEEYTSDDSSILDYFKEYRKIYYYNLSKEYGSHVFNSEVKNNKLIINIKIDYKDVDISKMIKNNYIPKTYRKGNSLSKNGAKLFYEDLGAVCGG